MWNEKRLDQINLKTHLAREGIKNVVFVLREKWTVRNIRREGGGEGEKERERKSFGLKMETKLI